MAPGRNRITLSLITMILGHITAGTLSHSNLGRIRELLLVISPRIHLVRARLRWLDLWTPSLALTNISCS